MSIYVTSINQGGGKTVISAGIAAVMQSLGYNCSVYKPIQTGAIDKGKYLVSPDLTFVKMLDQYITTHCTYMMTNKALPNVAAELEKINIDIKEIKKDFEILEKKSDAVIVEAPCNLLAPINENQFACNIPLALNIPTVVVVNPTTESVGHYISEIYSAKSLGVDIRGVIINKFPVYSESIEIKSFPEIIEKYCDVKVLGLIRNFKGNSVQTSVLINEILNGIDLQDVFNMKIAKLNTF